MSDVVDSVVSHLTSDQRADSTVLSQSLDRYNRSYDPRIHVSNPDGSPRITKSGKLVIRRKEKTAAQIASDAEQVEDFDAIGKVVAESFLMLCTMLGGDNWVPSPHERHALVIAWTEYCRARNVENLPPELFLLIALSGYAGPRLTTPTMKARIRNFFGRFTGNHQVMEE